MAIPEGKSRVQITLDDELLEILDFVASEAGITRSNLIENYIEASIEETATIAVFGLKPRYGKRIRESLEKHPKFLQLLKSVCDAGGRDKTKKRLGMDKKG